MRAPLRLLAVFTTAAAVLAGCVRHTVYRAATIDGVVVPDGVIQIERAHGLDAWRQQRAVQCELHVTSDAPPAESPAAAAAGRAPGEAVLDGVLTFTTDSTRARLDLRDGTLLVLDGRRAWVSPGRRGASQRDVPAPGNALFGLRAWPYFLSAPFKLRDAGARVAAMGELPLGGKDYPALRLTFGPAAGTNTAAGVGSGARDAATASAAPAAGDSPRDWYLLYRDPETDRIKAMAYVSTYGLKPGDLPRDPQAILYDDYIVVQGAVLATRWTFYHWSPGGGATSPPAANNGASAGGGSAGTGVWGDPIAHATLKNLHFTVPPDGFFDPPPGAREDVAPLAK